MKSFKKRERERYGTKCLVGENVWRWRAHLVSRFACNTRVCEPKSIVCLRKITLINLGLNSQVNWNENFINNQMLKLNDNSQSWSNSSSSDQQNTSGRLLLEVMSEAVLKKSCPENFLIFKIYLSSCQFISLKWTWCFTCSLLLVCHVFKMIKTYCAILL